MNEIICEKEILECLEQKWWTYRGEGNGNIVLALDNGFIIRFVKSAVDDSGNKVKTLQHEDTSRLRHLLHYVEAVVGPILGGFPFVEPVVIVAIPKNIIRNLNKDLKSLRPEFRAHKTIRENDCFALVTRDLCRLPPSDHEQQQPPGGGLRQEDCGSTFTFEIKPKCGFLPSSGSIADRESIKKSICKYHLMQHRKLERGEIDEINGYCPIELFSGCRHRVANTLRKLMDCPQNNLRIFQDGKLIYGQGVCSKALLLHIAHLIFGQDDEKRVKDESTIVDLCHLIAEMLLRDHPTTTANSSTMRSSVTATASSEVADRCAFVASRSTDDVNFSSKSVTNNLLSDGSVLGRLLRLQRDSLEVEDVLPLYQEKLLPFFNNKTRDDQSLHDYLYSNEVSSSSYPSDFTGEIKNAINEVRSFLLSCTAKDCSLMLTVRHLGEVTPNVSDEWIVRSPGGSSFVHKISFVDLDWKSATRIPRLLSEESDAVDAFQRHPRCEF